jgi:hypothetical protein
VLTLIDSISLAGDRAKQNDDAFGNGIASAWVIDGATDLHDEPLTPFASDAAWIAQRLNRHLARFAAEEGWELLTESTMRYWIRAASQDAAAAFYDLSSDEGIEPWQRPVASVLVAAEAAEGLNGLDLGDCRLFAIDAAGAAHVAGGPPGAADREAQLAAQFAKSGAAAEAGALYRAPPVLEKLRELRGRLTDSRSAVFSLNPDCAEHARAWSLPLKRPAHVLLATDGFALLADRYETYDGAGLVRAALDKGVHELGRELRAIETADAVGSRHPRWKRSDDATAQLLRLD